jgi:hypothetical protein
VREVSGAPIKFVGTGETMEALEPFYPERMANRILGMGDMLTLYEKAQEAIKVGRCVGSVVRARARLDLGVAVCAGLTVTSRVSGGARRPLRRAARQPGGSAAVPARLGTPAGTPL